MRKTAIGCLSADLIPNLVATVKGAAAAEEAPAVRL